MRYCCFISQRWVLAIIPQIWLLVRTYTHWINTTISNGLIPLKITCLWYNQSGLGIFYMYRDGLSTNIRHQVRESPRSLVEPEISHVMFGYIATASALASGHPPNYSLFTLRKPWFPLILNRKRRFLRVNRLYFNQNASLWKTCLLLLAHCTLQAYWLVTCGLLPPTCISLDIMHISQGRGVLIS